MEALLRPVTWKQLPYSGIVFRLLRTSVVGLFIISVANVFINRILPFATVRELTDEELARYREPYPTIASRKPIRTWPLEVPISGDPARVHDKVAAYSEWLTETEIPKLCLYADPGLLIQDNRDGWFSLEYIETSFVNTTMVNLGAGRHYLQEDHPHRIGEEIASWYTSL